MRVYKRGKRYWCTFSANGRRYRLPTKQADGKKAETAASLLLARALEKGDPFTNHGSKTLEQFWPEFKTYLEQLVAAGNLDSETLRYYRTGWNLLKQASIRGMRLDRITSDDAACVNVGKSPANRNNALRTLRRMLTKAVDRRYIQSAPKVKLVKEVGRQYLIEPWMEQKLLMVAEQPLRDVLLLMLDSGMRPAEVFRMQWEHIRWELCSIVVPKTKNGKPRVVPLSSRCKEALQMRGVKSDGWVFPAKALKNGGYRSKSGHLETVSKQWKEAKKLAGIPDRVVLYCARHTFGTDALQGTGNLAAVMKSMGHSQLSTAALYQHPELSVVREAIEKRNGRVM